MGRMVQLVLLLQELWWRSEESGETLSNPEVAWLRIYRATCVTCDLYSHHTNLHYQSHFSARVCEDANVSQMSHSHLKKHGEDEEEHLMGRRAFPG